MFRKTTKLLVNSIAAAFLLYNIGFGQDSILRQNSKQNDIFLSEKHFSVNTAPFVLGLENNFGLFEENELPNIVGFGAVQSSGNSIYGIKNGLLNHGYGATIDTRALSGLIGLFDPKKIDFQSGMRIDNNKSEDNVSSYNIIGMDTLNTNTKILKNTQKKDIYLSLKVYGVELGYEINKMSDTTDVRSIVQFIGNTSITDQQIAVQWSTEKYYAEMFGMLGYSYVLNNVGIPGSNSESDAYIINLTTPDMSVSKNNSIKVNAYFYGYLHETKDLKAKVRDRQILGSVGINPSITYSGRNLSLKNMTFALSSDMLESLDDYIFDKSVADAVSYVPKSDDISYITGLYSSSDPVSCSPVNFKISYSGKSPEYSVGVDARRAINWPMILYYTNNYGGMFDNSEPKEMFMIGIMDKNLFGGIRIADSNKEIFLGYRF